MAKSIVELVVGDLGEKRAYRQFVKQVNALPEDYRFAFKKIQNYMNNFGLDCDPAMLPDLLELFETSAAQGKPVLEVTGSDVAAFCDELIRASTNDASTARQKLNQEILDHFNQKGLTV